MKIYLVPSPFGLGFYITSDENTAKVQREELAARFLDGDVIYPPSEREIDLSDDDAVDLDIDDTRKRVKIKTLDSTSKKSRDYLRDLFNDSPPPVGDELEIRAIKEAFNL